MTWNGEIASDVVQIAILYVAIHAILKGARGSRFGQALLGVGILAAATLAFTYVLRFQVLSRILQVLLAYLAISSVVIFQPEIRRILATVGAFGFFERPKHRPDGSVTPEFVTETILSLAARRIGALFAFERGISLRGYESSGVALNAIFSHELVTCIFTPPLPLHDGGVIVRHGRLAAAHCVFPVSSNPNLAARGMRHRAAVGLSEETDALVIVVSEETGAISVASNGRLIRYTGPDTAASLTRRIAKALPSDRRDGLLSRLHRHLTKGSRA